MKAMEIIVDGKAVAVEAEGIVTFKDLLEHIEGRLVQHPRVVTRVVLNEENLDESQEVGLGGFPITDILSLEIHTADQLELAYEALEDAQIYLPELAEILAGAAQIVREGDEEKGVQLASEALECVGRFGGILDSLRGIFLIDFSQVQIDDTNFLDKLLQYNQNASDVLKAFQAGDWTLFADMIEYEISPMLLVWVAVIPEIMNMLPDIEGKEGGDEPE